MGDFTKIRHAMWLEDDWRSLTPPAQHLYMVLQSSPDRSLAGVADWKPLRLIQRAAEWTVADLMRAAVEASYSRHLVFDQDTEEVLVRSFIREDEIMKQWRMAVAVANSFGSIGSNKLRGVVVHELQQLQREQPELKAWEQPQVKTVLRQNAVDPRTLDTDLDMPLGFEFNLPLGSGLPQMQGGVWGSASPVPIPTPTPTPSSNEDAVDLGSSYPQGSRGDRHDDEKALRSVRAAS